MRVHYLEIVSNDPGATCAALGATSDVDFSAPVPALGGARTARLADGSWVGVRAPMHASEAPVVRPYWRVETLEPALAAMQAKGAEVALPPTAIEGWGRIAIVVEGGTQQGLWEP